MGKKRPVSWFKTDRRQFVFSLRDLTGLDQSSADNMFDGFLLGIRDWLLGGVRDLPPNTGSRLLLTGLGRFDITILPRGRRNPQRLAAGLFGPPKTTVRIEFHPNEEIAAAIRRANCELNSSRQSRTP
jgi:hypothetical protein